MLKKADQTMMQYLHSTFLMGFFIAIIEAAEERKALGDVSIKPVCGKRNRCKNVCSAVGKRAMNDTNNPLILHLDHSRSVQMCKDAIDNGYPSAYDRCFKKATGKNIEIVKEVVEHANLKEVHVESLEK
ncbi:MAG: class II fructose-bisphosphate aldolase [Actinomycetota bacterium]|nr:class II fructose-bisphosphate aldolase [Actinomycetota bacterium]